MKNIKDLEERILKIEKTLNFNKEEPIPSISLIEKMDFVEEKIKENTQKTQFSFLQKSYCHFLLFGLKKN